MSKTIWGFDHLLPLAGVHPAEHDLLLLDSPGQELLCHLLGCGRLWRDSTGHELLQLQARLGTGQEEEHWRNPQGQARPALRLPQRGLPPPCEAPPWLPRKSRKQMAQCRQDRPKQQPRWLRRCRAPSRSHALRPGLTVSSRNTAPGEHNTAAAPHGTAAPHGMTTIMCLAAEKNGGMSSAHVK